MGLGDLLTIQVEAEHGVTTVSVSGELDLATRRILDDALTSVEAEGERVKMILVDLRNVAFMDSSGLQTLLQAKERCGPSGPGLIVTAASPTVRRVFEVTGTEFLLGDESTLRTLRRLLGQPQGPDD